MKKDPLLIAFASQKGGVGKSAFTVLVASILHYQKGLKVGVVDCACCTTQSSYQLSQNLCLFP